ncbi:DUF4235 domain-containing protein [Aestuariimicrobium ganziense]|uniref:DUF4235 domain-containing protein n=1 Tax=Aestuariimicrobium ganziense TaxID=2773677 RepID=UPI001945850E|nr:DUF4235 domain-containing protein [Aestuariimicrobium ganziense]
MSTSEKLLNKVYAAAIGGVVTLVTQKILAQAWKLATGEEPPEPTNPEVPATTAFVWAMASGVGVGAAQLAIKRMNARRSWVRQQVDKAS